MWECPGRQGCGSNPSTPGSPCRIHCSSCLCNRDLIFTNALVSTVKRLPNNTCGPGRGKTNKQKAEKRGKYNEPLLLPPRGRAGPVRFGGAGPAQVSVQSNRSLSKAGPGLRKRESRTECLSGRLTLPLALTSQMA